LNHLTLSFQFLFEESYIQHR